MKKCIVALAVALLAAVVLAGCPKQVPLTISSTVPAAQAELTTGQDNNGNTVVDLTVKYLAPPQNLSPARSMYVVWVNTPDGRFFNAGRLSISDKLEGSIKVMTPYPRFRLVVSAEDDPLAASPGSQRVIETNQVEIGQ